MTRFTTLFVSSVLVLMFHKVQSFVMTSSVINNSSGLHCLECQDSSKPYLCGTVTLCSSDEQCYLEKIVTSGGLILYNSGCKSTKVCDSHKRQVSHYKRQASPTDVAVCIECCHGDDYCNKQGCGETEQTGIYCFNCPLHSSPTTCRSVQLCGVGKVCSISKENGPLGEIFKTECIEPSECSNLVGLSTDQPECRTCCDKDFCNNDWNNDTAVCSTPTSGSQSPPTSLAPPTYLAPPTTQTTTSKQTTPTSTATPSIQTDSTLPPTTTQHHHTHAHVSHTHLPHHTHKVHYCPQGDGYFSHKFHHADPTCLKIYHDMPKTWAHAQDYCQSEHAHLMIGDTQWRQHFARLNVNDGQTYGGALWLGQNFTGNGWVFIHGYLPSDVTHLPSINSGCGAILSHGLAALDCYDEHSFICERDLH